MSQSGDYDEIYSAALDKLDSVAVFQVSGEFSFDYPRIKAEFKYEAKVVRRNRLFIQVESEGLNATDWYFIAPGKPNQQAYCREAGLWQRREFSQAPASLKEDLIPTIAEDLTYLTFLARSARNCYIDKTEVAEIEGEQYYCVEASPERGGSPTYYYVKINQRTGHLHHVRAIGRFDYKELYFSNIGVPLDIDDPKEV
jgi:hypothetical protein